MTKQQRLTAAVFGVVLLAGTAAAGQASMLDSSEASAFMGTWHIGMELLNGDTFEQTLIIRDEGGKVVARLEDVPGGPSDITDITKEGDNLVLSFERPGQGFTVDIVMTLTLDGEILNATQVFDGRSSISGPGKKQ